MKHPLVRLYTENRKYILPHVIILLISLLAGVFKMLASILWGQAVDFGVAGQRREMLWTAGAMALVILLDCIRTALHHHIIGRVTEGMFLELRMKAFQKITKGDVTILERDFRTGDTAARLNSDIDWLNDFVAGHATNFSRLIFQGIFAILGCLFLSWQMSLAYLVILPPSLWAVKAISKPIQAQFKRSLDSSGSAMNTAADTISGALTVKAFALEAILAEKFDHAVDRAYAETVKTEKISRKLTGIKYVSNVLQTIALFSLGSVLVSGGTLHVGSLIAFLTLSNYISEPLSLMDYMISNVRRTTASAQRFYEVMDIPDEPEGIIREGTSPVPCEANDLAFSYRQETQVLKGIALHIADNRQVAIVGPSGCGKSTIIKLMCRFYLPESGEMKLFGVASKDWNAEYLRKNLALVTQDSCLFDGSIYENVAYGRNGATRADCKAALEEVGLWDFVSQFPDGMDHGIGEMGLSLSGGQKQRLCIARAMVKKAPLVLLDEATSALDNQTEKEVQQALDKLLAGKSAVIVAHRLTTVQKADYIYCMDAGKVIEQGSPKELLAKRGKYYELCRLQGLVPEVFN